MSRVFRSIESWYSIVSSYGVILIACLLFILTVCGFQVPSTLGPVMYLSWLRNELWELWEGSGTILNEKARLLEA